MWYFVSLCRPGPSICCSLKAEFVCWGRGGCWITTFRVVGGGQLLFTVTAVGMCSVADSGLGLCVWSLLQVWNWTILALHFYDHCTNKLLSFWILLVVITPTSVSGSPMGSWLGHSQLSRDFQAILVTDVSVYYAQHLCYGVPCMPWLLAPCTLLLCAGLSHYFSLLVVHTIQGGGAHSLLHIASRHPYRHGCWQYL